MSRTDAIHAWVAGRPGCTSIEILDEFAGSMNGERNRCSATIANLVKRGRLTVVETPVEDSHLPRRQYWAVEAGAGEPATAAADLRPPAETAQAQPGEPTSRMRRIEEWVRRHPNSCSIDVMDALGRSDGTERGRISATLAQLEKEGRLVSEPGMRVVDGKSVPTRWYRVPLAGQREFRPYKPASALRRQARTAPTVSVVDSPMEARAKAVQASAVAPPPASPAAPAAAPATAALRPAGRISAHPQPDGSLRIRVTELELELPAELLDAIRSTS